MGKKGGGKAAAKKARVIEEIYLYPKQEMPPITEGWIRLELKNKLWEYANLEFIIKTDVTIDKLIRKIQNSLGRIEKVMLYIADPTQAHNLITDFEQTLGNLLQTFGSQTKDNPDKYAIHYDFEPFNPKDPVLLAI
ncbi:hypothetical protein SteCoe_36708 [Stentor coeruleus]|uniref:Uncharacterized protein n=1 Tax=Stentor coeruleus TaxID=5963 RepID=A0A1R2APW3_9CILI|nr:hypothetical protein SteCoe_36708 [Stentor coeruleus]